MCIKNLGLYKFPFFLNITSSFHKFVCIFFFFRMLLGVFFFFFLLLLFKVASTFPYVDLFFLHCLSFFCTESWTMVPTSFAVGTGPDTLVAPIFFFFFPNY